MRIATIIVLACLMVASMQAAGYPVYQTLKENTYHIEVGTAFQVVWKDRKYLISNWHVCRSLSNKASASNYSGTEIVTVIATFPTKDLCVMTPTSASGLKIGSAVPRGYPVYTAGYPSTSKGELRLSSGVTTRKDKSLLDFGGEDCPDSFNHRVEKGKNGTKTYCERTFEVQDPTMYGWYGSSGSAVVNSKGELVGIVNMKNTYVKKAKGKEIQVNTASYLSVSSLVEVLDSLQP